MSVEGPLPEWMFDVYDNDVWPEDQQKSLLEELEIDPLLITKCVYFIISAPFNRYNTEKQASLNPFINNPDEHHHDFWGPCLMISLYALVLSIGRVEGVSWLFIIWFVASLIQHLTCRTWNKSSTLALHCAISGYSIIPFIPISIAVIVFKPSIVLALILSYIAIAWSSISAFKSYLHMSVDLNAEDKKKLVLLLFSVILMEMYFSSVLPMLGRS
jgi:hypothetical protein